MLGYIRGTTTTTGLTVEAHLDESIYCKGQKPSAEEIKGLSIQKHTDCPQWNYSLSPRPYTNPG